MRLGRPEQNQHLQRQARNSGKPYVGAYVEVEPCSNVQERAHSAWLQR